MNDRLAYTVSEIYRLANQYTGDVYPYRLNSVYDVFDYTRRIPFVRDIESTGFDEALKRPGIATGGGDCDDKAIFAGAALNRIKIPWRVKTVSFLPNSEMSHVYLEVFFKGKWEPFDATYSTNKIFTEKPFADQIVWSNPMLTRYQGVASLEGIDSSTVSSLASFIPIPGASSFVSIFSSFSHLLSGGTQHLSDADANAWAHQISDPFMKTYQSLTAQPDKDYMERVCAGFYNEMLTAYGGWWGGAMSVQGPQWLRLWGQNPPGRINTYIAAPIDIWLKQSDSDSIKQNFQTDIMNRIFIPHVITPLQTYFKGRLDLRATPEGVISAQATSGLASLIPTGVQDALSNPTVIIGLGVIVGLMMMNKKKGKRRR